MYRQMYEHRLFKRKMSLQIASTYTRRLLVNYTKCTYQCKHFLGQYSSLCNSGQT